MHHAFLYISLPSLHDYDVKMPNCKFMEDVNKRRRISVSLYNALFKKSPPGKFANICHFQQIGINVTVFEKRKFFLKVTFSLPLPSSMLKLPNVGRAVQTDPTLLRNPSESTESKKCWALLVQKFDQFQTLLNNSQPLATNRMCKRMQDVGFNDATSVLRGALG